MALLLRDFSQDLPFNEEDLPSQVADYLGVSVNDLSGFTLVRRSIDARKKSRVRKVYTVRFSCRDEETLLQKGFHGLEVVVPPKETIPPKISKDFNVLVVGMGPAGLFAAKWLAESGVKVTLIDRGSPVEQRIKDVESFWTNAEFNAHSNVQYGEGGAGTFSDGKLTTRLNHPLRYTVLKTLVDFGADEEILVEARPHVGTDRLRRVVINFRQELARLGVNVLFEACLTDLEISDGSVRAGVINDDQVVPCDALLLAPGHSARDTYHMLARRGVLLEDKSFAIGVRVEHPAELISRIQYGHFAPQLPTADYALRFNDDESGRGIYSFCMCPGGEVINAASEHDGLVVNGMSRMSRNSNFSNSALVVTVTPADWGNKSLGGIAFQQKWERTAFKVAGGGFKAPAQNMMNFTGLGTGTVRSSCRPGVVEAELREVLPDFVYDGLRKALPHFDRKMKGFITSEAVLVGVETRTSAPLRIVRNEMGESVSHRGLFPTGEGAGYAGGIMSAAFDGLRIADRIIQSVL